MIFPFCDQNNDDDDDCKSKEGKIHISSSFHFLSTFCYDYKEKWKRKNNSRGKLIKKILFERSYYYYCYCHYIFFFVFSALSTFHYYVLLLFPSVLISIFSSFFFPHDLLYWLSLFFFFPTHSLIFKLNIYLCAASYKIMKWWNE